MRRRGPKYQKNCQCQKPKPQGKPVKEIVYPVKENVVHKCTEETVKHVHPSHTTVMNHHLVKNEHLYPHTTSVENTYDEINMYGNGQGGPQVGGAMSPMGPGQGWGGKKPGKQCCGRRRRFW